MLVTEPMVACMAVYASFVYGLLFFQLESFPIVFEQERGWGLIDSTLPFLGLFTGVVFALIINIANQPLYARAVAKNKYRAVPEERLPPMILGGVLFSTGLFWFGWTAAEGYSWVLPVVAAGDTHSTYVFLNAITDICFRIYRRWIQYHLPTMFKFSSRYIWTVCCERYGWKYTSALVACLRTSASCPPNVP